MRDTATCVEIDLAALRHNFQVLRKRLGDGVKTLAVVKSNAYGHGAVPVARTLQGCGADLFGVGTVDEGVQLREAGIKRPILLLLGLIDGRFQELLRYQLTPVLYDREVARSLNRFLQERNEKMDVHLKIDTGMTRLGVPVDAASDFFDEIKRLEALCPVGLMTHLADAGDVAFSKRQVVGLEKAEIEFLKRFPAAFLHVANSLAAVDRRYLFDATRLGIALYGAYPVERQRRAVDLKPVMRWKSRLIAVKKVPKGTAVSYGRTFVTKKPSRIGVVPVGYADGYPRIVSNRASVLVKGRRVPVIGTVCMELTMVDLTGVPSVRAGDEVVLLGPQGRDCISGEEIGKWAGTISYEIFCRVAERNPRHYLANHS